ncbi:lipid phosphate phosphatase epsilon 2, chloroplastic isoform X2 [Euphorbia lathyris]|uniref:lipid phosphate phosphatase epsilon 2, chloroplastic isoform X2 n=1 Tax=Euphorbia lathyris TaxID=212925 RepID=UPI003313E599
MVATAALNHRPAFTLSFSHLSNHQICKPNLLLRLPASRSVFFGGFRSRKAESKRMIGLVETSAFRTGDSDNNLELIEEEALVKDSSKFPSKFIAQGLEPTLNRLSKWLVSVLFGGFILWRHDVQSLWIAMGSVLNALLSVGLKQILNQERPSATSKSDPGMPSSHAQCLFYTVVFSILSITESFGVNEFTLITSALTLASGSYFSWLRVSQKYHTMSQVAVGAAVGSVFSYLWLWILPRISFICDTTLAQGRRMRTLPRQ